MMHRGLIAAGLFSIIAGINAGAAQAACTLIKNVDQLQAMQDNLAGSYCLDRDIDAKGFAFTPIGSQLGYFTGNLNGRGHVVRNLRVVSDAANVGLFGAINGSVIRDLEIRDATVRSTAVNAAAGILAGVGSGSDSPLSISRVRVVNGKVRCTGAGCNAGGMFGAVGGFTGTKTIADSSSSASVSARQWAGGIAGYWQGVALRRTNSAADVACTATDCMAAGLAARTVGGSFDQCFSTGTITFADGDDSRAGGLLTYTESGTTVKRCYSTARVTGGEARYIAGLIAQHNSGGDIDQVYSAGFVQLTTGTARGLIANAGGTPTITNAYWDTETSGQAMSAAGTGMTTAQLRADLPPGFGNAWDITKDESYPFLKATGLDFASALATLVVGTDLYTFLPIGQLHRSQYEKAPKNADVASLAVAYTIVARAIGVTKNVAELKGVKIDTHFWNDATKTASWTGPVTTYAELGPVQSLAGQQLGGGNVVGAMVLNDVVLMRGTFDRPGGGTGKHWMLGTLFTRDGGGAVTAVLANDPWTGRQVKIDPTTKRVASPADFPLENFTLDAYRTVTIN